MIQTQASVAHAEKVKQIIPPSSNSSNSVNNKTNSIRNPKKQVQNGHAINERTSVSQQKKTLSELIRERRAAKKQKNQKPEEPEYKKKETSIKYSIKDGISTSIKSGFTESFVMPYAIALNASTNMLVAFSSVPQLIASFFQLFSQQSLRIFRSRTRAIFLTAFIQSFIWLPILAFPFIAKDNMWFLLLLISLESLIGAFQGPIYNSLLGDIIDEDKRGQVLGKRNSIISLVTFISTFIAGLILNHFKSMDNNGTAHYIFFGFAILFFIAFISRLIASFYKGRMYDPPFTPIENKTSFFGFLKNMTHDNYGIFILYVFLFKFAASLTAPFFELYLLRDLQMGYLYFTLITIASIVASFLAMSFWGKLIDKYGSKRILTIAGFLVPLSPLLLVVPAFMMNPTHRFVFLLIEEIFSGAVWAAFNLSTSSFLYDATTKEERIKHIAYYNFIIGIAIFIGALTGGFLIKIVPIWLISGIPILYLISGLLRFCATVGVIKKVREAKLVEVTILDGSFIPKVLSIRPQFGTSIEIIHTHHKKENHVESTQEVHHQHHGEPLTEKEKDIYSKKQIEFYRQKAIKTLEKQGKMTAEKEDLTKVDKDSAEYKKRIGELTQEIKKKAVEQKLKKQKK
jgi:MFS family permease